MKATNSRWWRTFAGPSGFILSVLALLNAMIWHASGPADTSAVGVTAVLGVVASACIASSWLRQLPRATTASALALCVPAVLIIASVHMGVLADVFTQAWMPWTVCAAAVTFYAVQVGREVWLYEAQPAVWSQPTRGGWAGSASHSVQMFFAEIAGSEAIYGASAFSDASGEGGIGGAGIPTQSALTVDDVLGSFAPARQRLLHAVATVHWVLMAAAVVLVATG